MGLASIGCSSEEPQAEVTFEEWAAEHAIAIEDLESDLSAHELESFVEIVGDAKYVGLGESMHDSREQVLMKGLLARHLIDDLGFRVLIFEASYPHALELDRFVTTGEGDLGTIINGLANWMLWDTEEFAEVIQWIRDFNRNQPKDDMVRVFGMDVMAPSLSVEYALSALDEAGVESSVDAQRLGYDLIADNLWFVSWAQYRELSDERKQELAEQYEKLVEVVRSNEGVLPPGTIRLALAAQYGNAMFSKTDEKSLSAAREGGLADMTSWILEQEASGRKGIIWGHNLHVAKSAFTTPESLPDKVDPMGLLLSDEVKEGYIAIGATFGSGVYSADFLPEDVIFEELPADTVDGACSAVGHSLFLLDFRKATGTAMAESWLAEEHDLRSGGSEPVITPGTAFDAVFYVDKITRVTPSRLAVEKYSAMSGG